MPWQPVETPPPQKPEWEPVGSLKGPPGPPGPSGPAGDIDTDVPDLTIIFENGLF